MAFCRADDATGRRVYVNAASRRVGQVNLEPNGKMMMKAGSHLIVDDLAAYAESLMLDTLKCIFEGRRDLFNFRTAKRNIDEPAMGRLKG